MRWNSNLYFFRFIYSFYSVFMSSLPAWIYLHSMHVWYTNKSEDCLIYLSTRVMNDCRPSCKYHQMSLGLPQKQYILLNARKSPEPPETSNIKFLLAQFPPRTLGDMTTMTVIETRQRLEISLGAKWIERAWELEDFLFPFYF